MKINYFKNLTTKQPIDPKKYQPELKLPNNLTRDQILNCLTSLSLDGLRSHELENYAREDCDRFLYTLNLVPANVSNLLEIGANPYFTTYLLKKFRPELNLSLTNYFGPTEGKACQTAEFISDSGILEKFVFEYININIEQQMLPLVDKSMDVVIFGEVIEHMTHDPIKAILEIKRVLKNNGLLILTTPNACRLENVARMISGANLYDPYSNYGPYGRHNREYTRHEIYNLMTHCGFSQEVFFTADVHDNHSKNFCDIPGISSFIHFRKYDLGQYLFSTWKNNGPAPDRLPSWLYRSYPESMIDSTPL